LIGIEERPSDALPQARPVRHVVERQRRTAVRALFQRAVEIGGRRVSEPERNFSARSAGTSSAGAAAAGACGVSGAHAASASAANEAQLWRRAWTQLSCP
jgi:hypothetical protein